MYIYITYIYIYIHIHIYIHTVCSFLVPRVTKTLKFGRARELLTTPAPPPPFAQQSRRGEMERDVEERADVGNNAGGCGGSEGEEAAGWE